MPSALRQIPTQSAKPFVRSYNPFNPAFRDTVRSGINELIGGREMGGTPTQRYRAGMADLLTGGVDVVPGLDLALGITDTVQAARGGNYGTAAILGGATMLGVLPIAGDFAGKAVRSIGGKALEGAPTTTKIPNIGTVSVGKNADAELAAQRASKMTGVPYRSTQRYAPVDVGRAEKLAREYDLMKNEPQSPMVQRAYNQMIDETMAQYDAMLQQGIEPFFINKGANPYPNSPSEALIDIAENQRLGIFPSVEGFGTDKTFNPAGNPMLQPSGRTISGQPALVNDIFRGVHDYYGHAKPGVGFRATGEENAFQSHAGMYSPLARRAMASETRGQNSWVNYGPYGETNRTANTDDTIFADQKTGLLPRWASEAGLVVNDNQRREFFDNLSRNRTGLEGAITDDGKLRLVHYSQRPLERVDPEFYGKGLSRSSIAERNRAFDPEFVKRSYYGIPASENPYLPEYGLGQVRNEVLIEPELIYDAAKNPAGLWLPKDPTGSERRISEAGYTGYYVQHPKLGKVASIFDPYDVSKTYMIPLGATVGLSALRNIEKDEEPQRRPD